MAETFPSVYAVETSMNDLQGRSMYSFLSENVGNDKTNKNLEEWVIRHNRNSEALIRPTSLGVALAFDLLFGKSDSKLANLVIIRHDKQGHHGTCYSIDNESCGNIPAMIMHNADDGFARIGEFAEKNFSENTLEQISNGLLDTTDNPHQPLKGSTQLLQDVRPILSQAIENDLNSGLITAFYERFAAMSDQDIKKIFDQYGDLLKQDERQHYIADIKARQSIVLQYLASIQVENNDKDNRLTLSRLT